MKRVRPLKNFRREYLYDSTIVYLCIHIYWTFKVSKGFQVRVSKLALFDVNVEVTLSNQYWANKQNNTNRTMVYPDEVDDHHISTPTYNNKIHCNIRKMIAEMIHKQLAASTAEVVLRNALPLPLVFGVPGTTEAQGGRKSMKPDPNCILQMVQIPFFSWAASNFNYGIRKMMISMITVTKW